MLKATEIFGAKWNIGLLSILFSVSSYADTSVWKISKDNQHIYLGGTIHILAEADYPLPSAYEKAYQSSHRIVFETDLQKLQSPAFQQQMIVDLTYKNGKTLKDVLSPVTYQKLDNYCNSRGIQLSSIHVFRPGLLSSVLLMLELQRLGMAGDGVDSFFDSRARQDAKLVGKLETVEQQLKFLVNMGVGKEDEFIEYTLNDLENLSALMTSMKKAWRAGDMPALERVGLEPYIDKFPQIMDNLLARRNNAWMPKIEAMLRSNEVEFVMVGALHLVGERGLLMQLKSRGYAIEQK